MIDPVENAWVFYVDLHLIGGLEINKPPQEHRVSAIETLFYKLLLREALYCVLH